MPPPLPEDKRAAILADIEAIVAGRSEDRSAGALAREHGVAVTTVSRIAKSAGLDPWQRAQTKRATQAREADMAEERSKLKARWMATANRLLDQLDQPYRAFSFGGKDNSYAEEWFDRPPPDALRALVTAAAIATDKHAVVHKLDTDQGAADGRSAIEQFMEAVRSTPFAPASEEQ